MPRSIRQWRRIAAAALLALCLGAPARAQISDDVVKIGVLNDQSGVYADLAGPGSVVAARMAVEDFGRAARPRAQPHRRGDRGGHHRFHRQGLLAHGRRLALRQLCAHHQPGARGDQARPRQLVLRHRRLRLRPFTRGRHHQGGAGERRQGAGRRAPPAQQRRLLVIPAAGEIVGRQGGGARQWRRRHDQRHQAGERVRPRRRRPVAGVALGVHHRRQQPWAPGGAGPDIRHRLLLGPRRGEPRLGQALLGAAQGDADDGACQRLLGDPPLFARRRGRRHRRGQGGGCQDARAAGRRFLRARRAAAPRRPPRPSRSTDARAG